MEQSLSSQRTVKTLRNLQKILHHSNSEARVGAHSDTDVVHAGLMSNMAASLPLDSGRNSGNNGDGGQNGNYHPGLLYDEHGRRMSRQLEGMDLTNTNTQSQRAHDNGTNTAPLAKFYTVRESEDFRH